MALYAYTSWALVLSTIQLSAALFNTVAAPTPLLHQDRRIQDYLAVRTDKYVEELKELIAIPSVSALPEHYSDIQAAADWLQKRLLTAGLQHAAVLSTGGPHPIVYGHWFHQLATNPSESARIALKASEESDPHKAAALAAEAGHNSSADDMPTLIIYGHYDVQPVDPESMWTSPPFNLTLRDGYYYGRGVDDDKGPLLEAIQAVEAVIDTQDPPPRLNIKFLIEGQEEVMSPHLSQFLDDPSHASVLRGDVVLSADGSQPSATQGGISLGLRGVMSLELTVTTADTDMHSGYKGGSVPNPCSVLSRLLAGLHDPDSGRITVDNFYEGVPDMTQQDKQDVGNYIWNQDGEAKELGLVGWHGEKGFSPIEQRWYRPTLDVVGMTCGFTGVGVKTVIPRTATAKISTRLVGKQRPGDIFEKVKAHLMKAALSYANISVVKLGGSSQPFNSDRELYSNQVAAKVSERMLGKKPLFLRDGATIPALAMIQSQLGLHATKWGWGLGEGIHAPNERVPVEQIDLGRQAWVELLLQLAIEGNDLVQAMRNSGHTMDQKELSRSSDHSEL